MSEERSDELCDYLAGHPCPTEQRSEPEGPRSRVPGGGFREAPPWLAVKGERRVPLQQQAKSFARRSTQAPEHGSNLPKHRNRLPTDRHQLTSWIPDHRRAVPITVTRMLNDGLVEQPAVCTDRWLGLHKLDSPGQ